MYTSLK